MASTAHLHHIQRFTDYDGANTHYVCEYCRKPLVSQGDKAPSADVVAQHMADLHATEAMRRNK